MRGSIDTYTLPYVNSGNFLYDARNSNPMLCDKLEGWDRVEGGREVQEGGDICISAADSC